MARITPTLAIALILSVATCRAAAAADPLPLFASDETLAITIEGPLDTLIRERSNEEYYDGLLRYQSSEGENVVLDLGFRTRGNYRRQKRTCRFPPVRLNLRRSQVEGTLFAGQNILKLVTHCRPNSGRYEDHVLREQLAYKIFNLVSETSFRTRLLRITWINTEDDNAADERYGFIIEHKNELESRLGLKEPGLNSTTYEQLAPEQAARAALFSYLIANTDYSMVKAVAGEDCCHNGILLAGAEDSHYFVPYDFDMSGIVDAPYATPNPRFKLRSVTSRLYRGHCQFNPYLDGTIEVFESLRAGIFQLIDDQEGLSDRTKKRVRTFVEGFYDDIGSPERRESKLYERCVGSPSAPD